MEFKKTLENIIKKAINKNIKNENSSKLFISSISQKSKNEEFYYINPNHNNKDMKIDSNTNIFSEGDFTPQSKMKYKNIVLDETNKISNKIINFKSEKNVKTVYFNEENKKSNNKSLLEKGNLNKRKESILKQKDIIDKSKNDFLENNKNIWNIDGKNIDNIIKGNKNNKEQNNIISNNDNNKSFTNSLNASNYNILNENKISILNNNNNNSSAKIIQINNYENEQTKKCILF